jgi:hypothetical protein
MTVNTKKIWIWSRLSAKPHARVFHSPAYDFDTLRVELLHYNIYVTLSCRHMQDGNGRNGRFKNLSLYAR